MESPYKAEHLKKGILLLRGSLRNQGFRVVQRMFDVSGLRLFKLAHTEAVQEGCSKTMWGC